jgi:hypothetical protein
MESTPAATKRPLEDAAASPRPVKRQCATPEFADGMASRLHQYIAELYDREAMYMDGVPARIIRPDVRFDWVNDGVDCDEFRLEAAGKEEEEEEDLDVSALNAAFRCWHTYSTLEKKALFSRFFAAHPTAVIVMEEWEHGDSGRISKETMEEEERKARLLVLSPSQ